MGGPALDSAWHEFVARLARIADPQILPLFFYGQNSRAFQIASHTHYALRIALLFRESARRMGGSVKITVGAAITVASLPHERGRKAVTKELRRATYALSGQDGAEEFVWPKHIEFK